MLIVNTKHQQLKMKKKPVYCKFRLKGTAEELVKTGNINPIEKNYTKNEKQS